MGVSAKMCACPFSNRDSAVSAMRRHYVGKLKCLGSGALMIFDPRPKEHQRFKLPDSLLEK